MKLSSKTRCEALGARCLWRRLVVPVRSQWVGHAGYLPGWYREYCRWVLGLQDYVPSPCLQQYTWSRCYSRDADGWQWREVQIATLGLGWSLALYSFCPLRHVCPSLSPAAPVYDQALWSPLVNILAFMVDTQGICWSSPVGVVRSKRHRPATRSVPHELEA